MIHFDVVGRGAVCSLAAVLAARELGRRRKLQNHRFRRRQAQTLNQTREGFAADGNGGAPSRLPANANAEVSLPLKRIEPLFRDLLWW